MYMYRFLPLNSWEDLHPDYSNSPTVFLFHRYQHFFCPPMRSSSSICAIYPQMVTFHPRRWSHAWPHCPSSKSSPLNSNGKLPLEPAKDQILPPPVTPTFLPALTDFGFLGASEYLEDLVAHIEGPQLDRIYVQYLDQLVDFRVPQLAKFIDRSVGPELTPFRCADARIDIGRVTFTLYRHANYLSWDPLRAQTTFCCRPFDCDVSHVARVLSEFSATLSNILHLKLWAASRAGSQLEGTDSDEWLHLLRRFSNMQTLYVCRTLAWDFAFASEDITAATEVLPSLN